MDAPALLTLKNVSVRRDGTKILHNISWEMRRGEHWCILGANGSGKTSLLTTLTGYLPCSEGQITVLGKTFGESDWRELRKRVGLVSSAVRQKIPDDEEAQMTVVSGHEALLGHWGKVRRRDLTQAREILDLLGCDPLARRLWRVLSQGERQRVLIGRALMTQPDLLILDEPCAGLDPAAREDFLPRIELLARSDNPPGLVLVTHHVEEITPAFTHVLLLKDGSIWAAGEKTKTLTSKNLEIIFQRPLLLHKRLGRYHLKIQPLPQF